MSYYFLYHKKGVPTWLAYFFILVLTLGLTMVFGAKPNRIISRATKNLTADKITVSNLTNNSGTVFFTTPEGVISSLTLKGENGSTQLLFDYRDQLKQTVRTNHYYHLANLTQNSLYRFEISLENKSLAKEYQFRTGAIAIPSLSNAPIFGKVLFKNLEPANEVFVRVKRENSSQFFTTLSKQTGEWLVSFPIVLDETGQETKILENTILTLEFLGAKQKRSLVKVRYLDAQPLRTILLGKDYDFTLPDSVLGIANNGNSRLITFPKNAGVITSFTPTFRGKGRPNTLLKLTLRPNIADLLVSVDRQGEWRYTPENPLTPSRYELYLKDGIIEESVFFTVGKSGEAVLGEATPSATTITPKPTAIPTPTATHKPSLITPTIIKDEIPELGFNNNFAILFASGLSLLGLFLVLY